MKSTLFKSAEFYRRRYHNFATLLIFPLACLVLFLLLFSLWGQTEVTVTSVGSVSPTSVISSIQSTSNNVILTNNLKNNKVVKKGDLLVQYSDKLEVSQANVIQETLNRSKRQEEALNTLIASLEQGTNLFTEKDEFGYSNTLNSFFNQSSTITSKIQQANSAISKQEASANQAKVTVSEQITSLNNQIGQYKELQAAITNGQKQLSDGNPLSSTLNNYLAQITTDSVTNEQVKHQFLTDIQSTISSLNSSITNLKAQQASNIPSVAYDQSGQSQIEDLRNQQLSKAKGQLTKLGKEIAEMQGQLDQTNLNKAQTIITAPQDGILHLEKQTDKHSYAPQGTLLAQLYPDITQNQTIAITYYVDSSHVRQLKRGQTVRLTLANPGKEPSIIKGRITAIDDSASSTKNGAVFKVIAQANLNSKQNKQVKYGMQGRVTSVVYRTSFFNYYKDMLLGQH